MRCVGGFEEVENLSSYTQRLVSNKGAGLRMSSLPLALSA